MDTDLSRSLRWAARLRLWRPVLLVSRGARELREGRLGEARRCFGEAIGRAPGWAEPYYFLGCTAAGDGSADEQESWYLAALERNPRHRQAEKALLALRAWRHAPVVRAWHLQFAAKYEESLAAFDDALAEIGSRAPESTRADCLAGIGWCYFGLADHPRAVDAFSSALSISPDLVHAHKGLGICRYHLGQYQLAEVSLRSALALNPELRDAQAFCGWCAYAMGRFDEALSTFLAAVKGNPLLGDARWGVAWSLWRLSRMDEARASFEEAIGRDCTHPSMHDAHVTFASDARLCDLLDPLAAGLLAASRPADALEVFASCGPTLRAVGGRALAHLQLGQAEQAVSLLSTLPACDSDRLFDERASNKTMTVTPRQLRARAALALGRTEEARELLDEAIRIRPEHGTAHLDLAELLLGLGVRKEAEAHFELARRVSRVRSARGLGELSLRRREPLLEALGCVAAGEHERALDLFGGQMELARKDHWRAALLRGKALLGLGRCEEALRSFQEAAGLAPDRTEPVLGAARSLESLDRIEEARDFVLGALTGSSDDTDLLEIGVRLCERSGRRLRARRLRRRLNRSIPA